MTTTTTTTTTDTDVSQLQEPGAVPQERLARPPIPADVWLQVALDADPLDVLALSQTCRDWQALFSEKQIWVRMLRAYMKRHGKFLVSSSIDNMTIEQLRRAAVGPQRWMRIAHARARALVPSETAELLEPTRLVDCTHVLPPSDHPIYHLVPGGRFLVTGNVETLATVILWDLGSPFEGDDSVRRPLVMAKYDFAFEYESYPDNRSLLMTGDVCLVGEAELRVVASYSHPGSQKSSALALSISLDDQVPLFRPLGTLRCEAYTVARTRVFGDRALFLLDTGVLLWNFTKSEAAICSRSSGAVPGSEQDIVLTDDYAILLKTAGPSTGISAWDISRLPTVPHTMSSTSAECAWAPQVQLPAPFYGTLRTLCAPEGDYRPNSVVFDVQGLVEPQGSLPVRKRYCASLTNDEASNQTHGIIDEVGAAYFPSSHYVPAPRPISTGIGTLTLDEDAGEKDGRMHTIDIPSVQQDAHSPATHPALGVNLGEGYPIASCPYSGRVIFQRRSGHRETLYCADYVCELVPYSTALPPKPPSPRESPSPPRNRESKPRVGSIGRLFSKSFRLSLK